MKSLKHPATLIAALALFVALGGGAYASGLISGSHIKNHSIAAKKLTKRAVRTLHGRRGPRGPVGEAGPAGPAGSAVAYAHINSDGTFDAAGSSGLTAANFTHAGPGQYCFSGLTFTPHNVVSTIDAASGATSMSAVAHAALGTASVCPSGSQAVVVTVNNDVPGDYGTYILFN
jgi:hypothetical protein